MYRCKWRSDEAPDQVLIKDSHDPLRVARNSKRDQEPLITNAAPNLLQNFETTLQTEDELDKEDGWKSTGTEVLKGKGISALSCVKKHLAW